MVIYSASTSQSQWDFYFYFSEFIAQVHRSNALFLALLTFCVALFFVCFCSERWHFMIHQLALSFCFEQRLVIQTVNLPGRLLQILHIFKGRKSRRDLHSIQVHLIVWSFVFPEILPRFSFVQTSASTLVSVNEKRKTIHEQFTPKYNCLN